MRSTKILATLGPASTGLPVLLAMLEAGMDAARLNMSHGEPGEHARRLRRLRRAAASLGRTVAVVLDLQGPKIRTAGPVPGGTLELRAGTTLTLVGRAVPATSRRLGIGLPQLARHVRPGHAVLLDDGKVRLRVVGVRGGEVRCVVERGGRLHERRGVHLPDTSLTLPPLGPKDHRDIDFGLRAGVDYVAQSFVARAADVQVLRRELVRRGGGDLPIIAKLERAPALDRLDEILEVADGVMVARGDLGVEIPVERVPAAQKHILARAGERGRLAITATQMLETMIEHPSPTRAEVSDVANAVFDGTDVLMLSGETAVGHDPAAAVAMMHRIAVGAETPLRPTRWRVLPDPRRAFTSVLAEAARAAASRLRARALVVVTRTGQSALLASKHRPDLPVYAVSSRPSTLRRVRLYWGVIPIRHALSKGSDRLLPALEVELVRARRAQRGDVVAFLGGWHGGGGVTDLLRLRCVATAPRRGRSPGGAPRSRRGSRRSRRG